MPRTRLIVGAVALALAASSAHAQRFSRVVSFGDSLSDAGNIGLAPGAAGGLGGAFGPSQSFTTNPDPVMVELLARYFGYANGPSLAGGTNFAWGGACARPASAAPCTNNPNPVTRLDAQIGSGLTGGVADPRALYTVWMGANDLFGAIPVWASNPATASANASVGGIPVAQAVVGQVGRLQAAGARYIVVLNLPDLGVTPQFSSGPAAAAGPLASLATVSFNGALSQGLSQLGTGVIPVNVFGLVNEVRANPAAFGFTNVTGVACTTSSSILCTPNSLAAPNANNTYLFADGVHPTGAAHRLLAEVAVATINAPPSPPMTTTAARSPMACSTSTASTARTAPCAATSAPRVRAATSPAPASRRAATPAVSA
jgi:outer membrane lipase/esterase